MKQPVLVDGRNLYDGQRMKQIGFRYRGVGRGFNGSMEANSGKTDGNHK
jgi:UDPglucose 6-dehydrogenase